MELQGRGPFTEHVVLEGDHLSAEHVVLDREAPDLARGGDRRTRLVGGDVQAHRVVFHAELGVGGPEHERQPGRFVDGAVVSQARADGDKVDRRERGRCDLAVRPARQLRPGDVTRVWPAALVLGGPQQVGESELPMPMIAHADKLVRDTVLTEERFEPDLHVDQVVGRPRLLHHLDVV